jgi:exonuclease VII small subunit
MTQSEPDGGPLGQIYLNLEETQVLWIAASLLERMSSHMVSPQAQELAEAVIVWKEGEGAVARLDQTLAAARERLPVLRSLLTALAELASSLEREMRDE